MSRRLLCAAAAVTLLGVSGVSACTSGNVDEADSSTAAATSDSSVPGTTPPSTSAAPTASTAPPPSTSTSAAPTSSAPTKQRDPEFTTTCTKLSVRVLKGGAIRGAEVAAMQFVNDGTTACTITGTPTAQLRRGGAVVGSRSRANGDAVRPFTVQPGDYAESLLRDFSTCNAPLSDALELRLPGRNGATGKKITEPITLRGCTLQVAPAGQPS